ncbi:MAG: cytochrome c oxidase subunit 3 [Chitinophagales bacterium]|nr:cytochrome c oxidase subunit 3 [Chitinophagales bacterium]MDW8272744.1 cytochrome c oxidase subunit 3 [Chitinophagales bacterium]
MITSTRKDEHKGRVLRYHPLEIVTYILLGGISVVFFTLSLSYFMTAWNSGITILNLPLLFHANTVIILVSSYCMHQTKLANERNDHKAFSNGLIVTASLGIAFAFFQVLAWQELVNSGIRLTNNVAGAYLYVISGLHLAHLLVGIVLMGIFWLKAKEVEHNPVAELLFETDPMSKIKINLLSLYWHFVDGLWVYLYLFFVTCQHLAKNFIMATA